MTGRAGGSATLAPASLALSAEVTRRWLLVSAALAAGAHYALAAGVEGFAAPEPIIVLAAIAIGADVRRLSPAAGGRVGAADWALFAGALLACMTPFRIAAAPALVFAGVLAWRSGGVPGRSAGVLLMALAGWGMKDAALVELASSPILAAEAHLTSFLLDLVGVAATASGNRILLADGHAFVVLRSCSTFSLVYPCAVGTYALSRLVRPAEVTRWPRVAAALALLLVVNSARLAATAASPEAYTFLHSEAGALPTQAVWAAIVILAAAPSWRRR